MKLAITSEAEEDLLQIYLNILDFVGIESAENTIAEFYRVLQLALTQPLMGVEGIVENTRELFPKGGIYRIVYRIKDDELQVLNIVLAKQQYPF